VVGVVGAGGAVGGTADVGGAAGVPVEISCVLVRVARSLADAATVERTSAMVAAVACCTILRS